uniref:Mitochondrial ribosomal protein S34 n=1 Tax=Timema genevievae TaxID=629358 RepID=A0A7R9K096_TIMGE|nr:unnamed protein product [Timema genevievae]
MPIKYIGRTTDFKGKTLWEILGNLKNFGVGRIVVRSMFERYPEPSYMKILKVEPVTHEDCRKVRVLIERVFRGRKYPKPVGLYSVSYKADYRLLHKDEEADYCSFDPVEEKPERILPRTALFPPLFRELIVREMKARGEPLSKEPLLEMRYHKGPCTVARIAREGEVPTVAVGPGLGIPASPQLYQNCGIKQ